MVKALVAVCLMVVFVTPAFADMKKPMGEHKEMHHGQMEMCKCEMKGHHHGDMMKMVMHHAKELGITEDQMNKLSPIHREMEKKEIKSKAEIKIAVIDLKGIMEVKDFDLEKANAQVKKIADLKLSAHLDMLNSMKECRSILTDEQFKKIKQMMHMHMEGREHEHHKEMTKKK